MLMALQYFVPIFSNSIHFEISLNVGQLLLDCILIDSNCKENRYFD